MLFCADTYYKHINCVTLYILYSHILLSTVINMAQAKLAEAKETIEKFVQDATKQVCRL